MNFYEQLPPFDDFREAFNADRYQAAPGDWVIAIADIRGSTAAVRDGQYKQVNMVGASAIIAVLNVMPGVDIPYVFGGDGASFLLPPENLPAVVAALRGTQRMAVEVFGLELRCGVMTVEEARAAGHDVRIARYRLSENIRIAMFGGSGLTYAEKVVKDPASASRYDIRNREPGVAGEADFTGLECRWNPVGSQKGEIVTLVAQACEDDSMPVYRDLFAAIEGICGGRDDYRPVRETTMKLSADPNKLRGEFGVRTHGKNLAARARYLAKLAFESALGKAIFRFDLTVGPVEGRQHIADGVRNTDFQKFDNTLRMVMDNTPEQTAALRDYLEGQFHAGKLFYGLYTETQAIITCMVFDRRDRHVHFIDGASGGYTLAAKAMKDQMKQIRQAA